MNIIAQTAKGPRELTIDRNGLADLRHPCNDEPARDQIDVAKTWITLNCRQMKRFGESRDSYGWKHVMHNDNKVLYVSGGAFIVALVELGYVIRADDGARNVYVKMGLTPEALERLRKFVPIRRRYSPWSDR